jgi:hypothetical protein
MEIKENKDAQERLTLETLDYAIAKAKEVGSLRPFREEDLTLEEWHKLFNGLAILQEHIVLPPGVD